MGTFMCLWKSRKNANNEATVKTYCMVYLRFTDDLKGELSWSHMFAVLQLWCSSGPLAVSSHAHSHFHFILKDNSSYSGCSFEVHSYSIPSVIIRLHSPS